MILQALVDYYNRKAADSDSDIAPPGWERKELPFLIVLDSDGRPVSVEDTRELSGKKLVAKSFLLPHSVKRSVGIVPNLLWDNVEYATGVVCKGKPPRVAESHAAFVDALEPFADIPAVQAVIKFCRRSDVESALSGFPAWKEMKETCAFVSFKIAGSDGPVFREAAVAARIDETACSGDDGKCLCLVTGAQDVPATLHPAIKGVRGCNTTGGNIVSFNFDAASSFGRRQGMNAPVGERAAFAYTTALNTLLGKNSRNRLQVGDATTVFWSERRSAFEDENLSFWEEPDKDDPDRLCGSVEALLKSVATGALPADEEENRFFVLGLSPNAGRISVRFWHVGTVAEMKRRYAEYFNDLEIACGPNDRKHVSLFRLLVSLAPLGKSENIPPNLAGAVMRAILEGLPFPEALLQAAVRRCAVERAVVYARAKLIKGCLNRKNRHNRNSNKGRSLTVSLDKENTGVGYRLGRLFAMLEKIQQEANQGINATIRDKFYAAASATPATVFGNLMRLKNHHLSKLDNAGRRIWFERELGEIISGLPTAFPAHLPLDEQGAFAIGYYHQVRDLWTKKSDKENPA